MKEVGLELTAQELGVLTRILGLPAAAGLEENPIDDLPEVAQGPVVDAVVASLEARGIVMRDSDDDLDVAESVKIIMTVASVPSLIGAVSRQIDDVIETTFLSVTPDLAVEVTPVAHSVYRFTPFAAADLLARVLRISDLHPVARIDGVGPLEVHQDRLDACADHLENGDSNAALTSLGGDPAEAGRLLDAMKTKRSSSQVTILHKPGDGRVEGGSVAWIDAGFGGIWTMEEVDDGGEPTGMIRIENRDSRELAVELFGFLPDAFTADDAGVVGASAGPDSG